MLLPVKNENVPGSFHWVLDLGFLHQVVNTYLYYRDIYIRPSLRFLFTPFSSKVLGRGTKFLIAFTGCKFSLSMGNSVFLTQAKFQFPSLLSSKAFCPCMYTKMLISNPQAPYVYFTKTNKKLAHFGFGSPLLCLSSGGYSFFLWSLDIYWKSFYYIPHFSLLMGVGHSTEA